MNKKIIISIILSIIIVAIGIIGLCIKSAITNSQNTLEDTTEIISKFYNPIIPDGFKKVDTKQASWELNEDGYPTGWNKGLVIEDEIGNQFVWVPVEEVKYITTENAYSSLHDTESQEEKELIRKYGGFYISRYEAGLPTKIAEKYSEYNEDTNDLKGIPLSQVNSVPWNYISLKNAKINATSMYNTKSVKSDLLTTRQWLQTIEWLYLTNPQPLSVRSNGNFSDSFFVFSGSYSTDRGKTYTYGENIEKNTNMLLKTGTTEKTCLNNIYDLFGNVAEYTDGYVPDSGYYSVGGYFDEPSIQLKNEYATYNPTLLGVEPLSRIGFRIVLYLQ